MEWMIFGFYGLYAIGGALVLLAGAGGLIYYLAKARSERKNETFERRKW